MVRQMIKIDEALCNGCGLCVQACHEGAIAMVDGKAKLMREDYCDGLGNCLPVCPTGAISFEEREAPAFVMPPEAHPHHAHPPMGGCPGSRAAAIRREPEATEPTTAQPAADTPSQLMQWPVQIKLVPVNAPYLDGAHLLIAADCAAYAHSAFHNNFMRGKVTIIGCPKLDEGDYSEKLTEMIARNNIKSVTIVRMEVPCCGGLSYAAQKALQNSGKFIPWRIVTIATDGTILED